MAWNNKLVTSSMLQDIFGIPAVSSLGTYKYITYDDIYRYQGDWNTSLVEESGNHKILTIDDLIYQDGIYNGWIQMGGSNFNVCRYDMDVQGCYFDYYEQNNTKNPFADLDNVTIRITFTSASGTTVQYTIDSINCQQSTINPTSATSNIPQRSNIDVELSVVNISTTNTELRYQQIYFWEVENATSNHEILCIYGNSTEYRFKLPGSFRLSNFIKHY